MDIALDDYAALFLKLDGYADSATIAQAAENAKAAAGGS